MRLREQLTVAVLLGDRFRHQVVGVDERIATGLCLDALDEHQCIFESHVLRCIRAIEIESYQVVRLGLDDFQKEVGLFDRIARLAEMISAPLVATLLCFDFSLGIFAIDPITNRRAMNDRNDALVRRELIPINRIAFERIDGDGDVRVLPGFVEFGRLSEDYSRVGKHQGQARQPQMNWPLG